MLYSLPNPVKSRHIARLYWSTTNASPVDLMDDNNEYIKKDAEKSGYYDVVLSVTSTCNLRVTGPSDTLDLRYAIKVE